jgi:hypothetical protein
MVAVATASSWPDAKSDTSSVPGKRHVPREQAGPDVTGYRGMPGQRGRHVHHV